MADPPEEVTTVEPEAAPTGDVRVLARRPGGRVRSVATIDDVPADAEWVWIDAVGLDDRSIVELAGRLEITSLVLEDLLDFEQLPKVDDFGDQVFVVLHALTERDGRIDTAELDAVLTDGRLFTLRAEHTAGVDWLFEAAAQHPELVAGGTDVLLAHVAEASERRYLPLIEALEDRVEALGEEAVTARPHVPGDVQALRRDIVTVRKVLRPQRAAITALSTSTSALLGEDARRRFEDVGDLNAQVVESLSSARLLLSDALDAYRAAVAEKTGEVTRVLTVYAALVLPMSLVAGIYGMNVSHLPADEEPYALAIVLAVMGGIAACSWLAFVRMGFIGAPSLRTLPSAVGRGLVGVARTPVRTVSVLLPIASTGGKAIVRTAAAPVRRTKAPRPRRRDDDDPSDGRGSE